MEIPGARWIVAGFGLITCILIAVYVVKAFRDMALGNSKPTTSYLDEFQRLRDEGKLDNDEYERLKKSIPKTLIPDIESKSPLEPPVQSEAAEPKFVELRENE